MLLFSATFEESVLSFAKCIVLDANIIRLKKEKETLDTIKQFYVLCESREERFQAICNIYGAITIAQAIIFCQVGHLWTLPENTGQRSNSFFSLRDPDEEDCRLARRRDDDRR